MAKISKELWDKLTEYLASELGGKVLSGVTYTIIFRDEKQVYERFLDIKKEVLKCGFADDEIFRVYEVCNGYIADMDLSIAKRIANEIFEEVAKNNGQQIADKVGDYPESRRKSDMIRLAKHVQKELDKGNDFIEVALFSRNSVPRIRITGLDVDNKPILIEYKAYAIRHWDIERINSGILIPRGMRIRRIEPYEILPAKNGVRFILYLERI